MLFRSENTVETPDLITTKYSMDSSLWYFSTRRFRTAEPNTPLKIAQEGSTDEVIERVTRSINGGINGLADRTTKFRKVYQVLTT